MGDLQSAEQNKAYPESLTFIETTNDRNFGPIDIYRTNEPPYEYIMDNKKSFI